MKHLETRQLIKELAKKHGLSIADATAILDSVIEFTKVKISTEVDKEKAVYPSIRIPNMGTFYVKEGVKKHIQIKLLKRKEEQNESI
jgi:nucleoid DNA-binding protein